MKYTFLLMMLALGNLISAEEDSIKEKSAKRPNIVFIFSDDHALKAIGPYKGSLIKTPNIDRLAKMGAVFENTFCANSICGPSRACILTGKHSHKNGFRTNQDRFDGNQMTFPKLLQKGGYKTAIIGKWHLQTNPQGFDHWELLPGQGNYYNPNFYTAKGRTKVEGYCTDIVTDKALKWMDEAKGSGQPFLLMCQHKAPHRTWAPNLKYLDLYRNHTFPEPASLFDNYENRSETLKHNVMSIDTHFYYDYDLKVPGKIPFASKREHALKSPETRRMNPIQLKAWKVHYEPLNAAFLANPPKGKDLVRWKYQRYMRDYMATVKSVDDSVGRILDYLEKNNMLENTIIVYSSDQGFYLGEHGWYDKRWMFEESLSMPFIMSWPGVLTPGSRRKELIQNIDYGPTFLEAAGVEIPKEMQGRSFGDFLKRKQAWRDNIYYHYYEAGTEHNVPAHDGVRTKRYKIIHFYKQGHYNLYDLESDPNEMKSVHDNPEYAGVMKTMQAKLIQVRKDYKVGELNMEGRKQRKLK